MTVELKDKKELELMAEPNRMVAIILKELGDMVKAGIETRDIDNFIENRILEFHAKPAFKGYRGFPASSCISINEEIVHGIPGKRKLVQGDIVSIDIGIYYNNFYGDAAKTFCIGDIREDVEKLVIATEKALYKGIEKCRKGKRLGEVSSAIYDIAESAGLGVIKTFVGHGIGRSLHEDPQVPNYLGPWSNFIMEEGLVISLEPMFCLGDTRVKILYDGWTAITRDKSISCHFEHTIAITDKEAKILTLL